MGEIEKYDMGSFRPPSSGEANRHANQFAQMTADSYLLTPPGGQPPIETAAALFEQFAGEIERDSGVPAREEFERSLRDEVCRLPDFTVFGADDRESPYKQKLYGQVLARIHRRRASGQCPEAARGCSCESGIMVLKRQTDPRTRSTQ